MARCFLKIRYGDLIKTDSSKDQNKALSKFISALPPEVLKKIYADILELIIKDRAKEREQEHFDSRP
jgi:hypothetical protein